MNLSGTALFIALLASSLMASGSSIENANQLSYHSLSVSTPEPSDERIRKLKTGLLKLSFIRVTDENVLKRLVTVIEGISDRSDAINQPVFVPSEKKNPFAVLWVGDQAYILPQDQDTSKMQGSVKTFSHAIRYPQILHSPDNSLMALLEYKITTQDDWDRFILGARNHIAISRWKESGILKSAHQIYTRSGSRGLFRYFFPDPARGFLIVPWFRHSLQSLIPARDSDTLLYWSLSIAKAVLSLHKSGFRHRDIKPQNILTSDKKNLILADLDDCSHWQHWDGLTGSPGFISEELISSGHFGQNPYGNNPDEFSQRSGSADMYALGMTMLLMAGEKRLWKSSEKMWKFASQNNLKRFRRAAKSYHKSHNNLHHLVDPVDNIKFRILEMSHKMVSPDWRKRPDIKSIIMNLESL